MAQCIPTDPGLLAIEDYKAFPSGVTSNAASRGRVKPGQLRGVRDGC